MLMNDNARMFDGYGITYSSLGIYDFDGERRRENVWWVVAPPPKRTPAKTGAEKLFSRQNFYVSEFVEIVPGILCYPHQVIFASISV
jgi:hypothetical protein